MQDRDRPTRKQEEGPSHLTIRLAVQPIFLFSVSSPFMQSLEGKAHVSVPGSKRALWDNTQNCRVTDQTPAWDTLQQELLPQRMAASNL